MLFAWCASLLTRVARFHQTKIDCLIVRDGFVSCGPASPQFVELFEVYLLPLVGVLLIHLHTMRSPVICCTLARTQRIVSDCLPVLLTIPVLGHPHPGLLLVLVDMPGTTALSTKVSLPDSPMFFRGAVQGLRRAGQLRLRAHAPAVRRGTVPGRVDRGGRGSLTSALAAPSPSQPPAPH